jgi:NAD+ diphosphatase
MPNPRFTLGVLGVILDLEKVLLVRTEYAGRKWQLPGGYAESGESPDQTLRREIREELGVEVELIAVVGTYVREFDHSINIAFRIDIPISQIEIDGCEIQEARLFAVQELPKETSLHTNRIIMDAAQKCHSRVVFFSTREDSGLDMVL